MSVSTRNSGDDWKFSWSSNHSCSDAAGKLYGSEKVALPIIRFARASGGQRSDNGRKKFQFDLEDDFPSPSSLKVPPSGAHLVKLSRSGPVVSQSRPIAITQGFAAADQTTSPTAGSSLENGAAGETVALKRRRKRFPCQRATAFNLVGFPLNYRFNLTEINWNFDWIGWDVDGIFARRGHERRCAGRRETIPQSGQSDAVHGRLQEGRSQEKRRRYWRRDAVGAPSHQIGTRQ